MVTEMIVYSSKIKEEVTAIQTEIKKNIQETNSEGKETRTQINHLKQKEERNIQPEKNEDCLLYTSDAADDWLVV